ASTSTLRTKICRFAMHSLPVRCPMGDDRIDWRAWRYSSDPGVTRPPSSCLRIILPRRARLRLRRAFGIPPDSLGMGFISRQAPPCYVDPDGGPRTNRVFYRFADYSLDSNRRELRRGDRLLSIEPKVFDLLLHLITNRERVVSKEDLIAAVWNGRIVSESALTTCINA